MIAWPGPHSVASLASGTFSVVNTDGLLCHGTYDQWESSALLKVRVNCNDGRYGTVAILRSGKNMMNGSGEGELNDGTIFRVYMGDQATQKMWSDDKLIKKTIVK